MQNLNLDGFELLFTIFICFNSVIMRTSIFYLIFGANFTKIRLCVQLHLDREIS
jgi:hypothetical protein